MATSSRFPTANEQAGEGSSVWTNPNNAHADDSAYATAVLDGCLGPFAAGNYWKTFGFDGAIPAGSPINSVKIEIAALTTAAGAIDLNATVGGVEQATHTITPTTSRVVYTTDVTADRAWTRADLLDATFKVDGAALAGLGPNETLSLDYIKVIVDYTPLTPTGAKPGTYVITRQSVNRGSTF